MLHHRRHFLLLTLPALLLTLAPSSARADDFAPPTVKDNVTIQFPKGWTVNTKNVGHALMTALAPTRDKDDSGEFQASFSIALEAGAKLDGAAQQARVAKEFPDYRSVEAPTAITVNGLEGVTFGGTFSSGKRSLRSRQYIFPQGNQLCVITFTSLNSRWANYRTLVDASVATFSLKKVP